MDAEPRAFVIPVRRKWTLLILPILALAYFVAVLVLVVTERDVGVSRELLAWAGAGLFVLVVLFELLLLLRRRGGRGGPAEGAPPTVPDDFMPEPLEETAFGPGSFAPEPPRRVDDEYATTDETQQGYRVLEYSIPAKSRHRGAVYAKAYVPVTKEHVLRVETLAAEGQDL